MEPSVREPAPTGSPEGRERRTLRLALIGGATMILLPLLWFLAGKAMEKWPLSSTAGTGALFDKRPAAAPQAPAPPAPVSQSLTPPQIPGPAPAASPAAATGGAPAPAAARADDVAPGTVLKVVEVRYPPRGEETVAGRQPKLKPMKGWTPTTVRSIQDTEPSQPGPEPVYYITPKQSQAEPAAPASAQKEAPGAPAEAQPGSAPQPEPKPQTERAARHGPVLKPVPVHTRAEPSASGLKPLPPVLTTTVGPAPPTGTMDHVPGQLGTDFWPAAPTTPAREPGEPSRPDGTCGRQGWWKNSWTQWCYSSLDACKAAEQTGACTR